MSGTLYHYTSIGAAKSAADYGYLKCNPPMPPRYMEGRKEIPTVVFLTTSELRTSQRWAGVPTHGTKGMAYLDRAAARIAVTLSSVVGARERSFRSWALDYNIPTAWIEEAAQGGSTADWWVVEREVAKDEWQELALWDGLRYVPKFTRKRPAERLVRG